MLTTSTKLNTFFNRLYIFRGAYFSRSPTPCLLSYLFGRYLWICSLDSRNYVMSAYLSNSNLLWPFLQLLKISKQLSGPVAGLDIRDIELCNDGPHSHERITCTNSGGKVGYWHREAWAEVHRWMHQCQGAGEDIKDTEVRHGFLSIWIRVLLNLLTTKMCKLTSNVLIGYKRINPPQNVTSVSNVTLNA